MPKTLRTPEEIGEIMKEVDGQSDRAAGIVAACIVEELLELAIKERFVSLNGEHRKAIFEGPTAPLSSFSGKIEIGFAIGLYGEFGYQDLEMIRSVRNKFAHRIETILFSHSDIIKAMEEPYSKKPLIDEPRHFFMVVVRLMMTMLILQIRQDIKLRPLMKEKPEIFRTINDLLDGVVPAEVIDQPTDSQPSD